MMGLDSSGMEWSCPWTAGLLGEGTPAPLQGREAPCGAGEEPAVPPRLPHPGSALEPPSQPPPPRGAARAPLGVLLASMAFLTARKGAASRESDRRYQAGRGPGEWRGGGRGVAGEQPTTEGTAEGAQLETAMCRLLGAG